ncbi:MAG: hypothetical protein KC457_29620, partial [Myxococcales bacterium]|nr:hypothetical protein [Myxococcales bacterium]
DLAKIAIDEELAGFQRRLQELREAMEQAAEAGGGELDGDALSTLQTRCRGLLPKPASKRLRQVEQKLRRSNASRQIRQALRESFAREAGAKTLAATELAAQAEIPARLRLREVDVRELVDGEVAGRLIPRTERETDTAAKVVAEAAQATQAMVGDVELLLELYRGREENTGIANLRLGLEKVSQRLTALSAEETGKLEQAARGIEEEFDLLDGRLSAALDEATGASEAARWVSRQRSLARQQFGRSLIEARERALVLWTKLRQRAGTILAALDRDYRLRSGLTLPSATAIAEMLRTQDTLDIARDYRALFDEQP